MTAAYAHPRGRCPWSDHVCKCDPVTEYDADKRLVERCLHCSAELPPLALKRLPPKDYAETMDDMARPARRPS